MEYRKMEKLGIEVSLLGFGCMRFPTTKDGAIDEVEAGQMLKKAYAAGVNYFDTAYPYHGGKSEVVLGKTMADLPRDSFYMATKLPVWKLKETSDVLEVFNEQLGRLQTDYVDFYLLHSMDAERLETVEKLGILPILEDLKAKGAIRHLGFSFHDEYPVFEKIARMHDWDFCQIQLNYMDTDVQAGLKGYKLTEELGIPLVVMEPVKGGVLATFPTSVAKPFADADPQASTASWALRWVGTLPHVKVILSGMSSLAQVEDNLKTFDKFVPLSDKEQEAVAQVKKELSARRRNGCTGCKYCMPCPAGVDIPHCFNLWNNLHVYENTQRAKDGWTSWLPAAAKPDNCVKCGQCEEACPQHISIRDDLEALNKELNELCGA
ncbi:MAG: aldo/keto reductase [Lachnospiraceae bacterium]|jgi:predicted aldo/keto reductase-like oxidoreductase|nr:aldo/keto reductase [Lachnospiraceae bacterium]